MGLDEDEPTNDGTFNNWIAVGFIFVGGGTFGLKPVEKFGTECADC